MVNSEIVYKLESSQDLARKVEPKTQRAELVIAQSSTTCARSLSHFLQFFFLILTLRSQSTPLSVGNSFNVFGIFFLLGHVDILKYDIILFCVYVLNLPK